MSDQILEDVRPTRMELLQLRARIQLAQNGHELLKKKVDALIIEFYSLLDAVKESRDEMRNSLKIAFDALIHAEMSDGSYHIKEIAKAAPSVASIKANTKNIMGVRVPQVEIIFDEKKSSLYYGLATTTIKLDQSSKEFKKGLQAILVLAEKMAILRKIAAEVSTTKRRVNALNYIIIPRLVATTKFIELNLEEQERETFTKLKHIKRKIEEKNKDKHMQTQDVVSPTSNHPQNVFSEKR